MRKLHKALSLIIALAFSGCGPTHVVTTAPRPNLPLSISTTPKLPVAGHDMRIVCQIPPDINNGNFIFGVEMAFSEQGPIDRLRYERTMTMGCLPITIVCGYREYKSPLGWQKPVTITQTVTPLGECN